MPREPLPVLDDFVWHLDIPTRWGDHDSYGHVNNAVQYSVFETTIMRWLEIEHGLATGAGPVRCFTVENGCQYHAPVKHPATLRCGLRVGRLGSSSVRYELGVFDGDTTVATGFVVDVFVAADTERPTAIPDPYRTALSLLVRE
jgi:acyl-CoA thioester hydrolase